MSATFTDLNQVEYEIISPVPDGVARPTWYDAIKRGGLVPTYVRVLSKPYHIDYATVGACHWCALHPSTISAAAPEGITAQ